MKSSLWSLKKIIDYVLNKEKTDEKIISGKNCLPENAYFTMKATKDIYEKTDGRSYYHLMQSFKPGELSPELTHSIGKELAEKQFKNFEVVIATHIDKKHIHNHFVINSVSFRDGYKLVNDNEKLREIKRESNRICERENLSVIKEPYAKNRYSMAEYKLAEKGQPLWKEQLRAAIDEAKENSEYIFEMKDYLEKNFNVKIKIQNVNLSFLHPDKQKYCRGTKLGFAYTKEEVFRYLALSPEERKSEREEAEKPKAEDKQKARNPFTDKNPKYEKWKKENPEAAKAAYEKWKEAHPEEAAKRKEEFEKWKMEHPEEAKEAYEKWEKENPEEAKAAYEEWEKENPEESKEAYERWKGIYLEEARAAAEQKYLEWKAAHKPNTGLSKVGLGIESITNKIARDIEKEKIRVDKKKAAKAKAREKYRGKGRDRDRGDRGDRDR